MLNIENADRVLVLYIPHNGTIPVNGMELGLIVVSTHDASPRLAFTFQGWEVVGDFVKVCVERPEGMHDGEWEYVFQDAEGVIYSKGLMQVGRMPGEGVGIQYNKVIEYKEYGNE